MTKYRKIILIILVMVFLILSFIACNSEPKYTSQEWEEKQEEPHKEIEREKRSEEIENYNRRLNRFNTFLDDFFDVVEIYEPDINELVEKFNNEKDNIEKKKTYAELIIEKKEDFINELSELNVPEEANVFFNFILESETNAKLSLEIFLSSNSNKTDYEEYQSKQKNADINARNELNRIYQRFNDEASKLNIVIPFPFAK